MKDSLKILVISGMFAFVGCACAMQDSRAGESRDQEYSEEDVGVDSYEENAHDSDAPWTKEASRDGAEAILKYALLQGNRISRFSGFLIGVLSAPAVDLCGFGTMSFITRGDYFRLDNLLEESEIVGLPEKEKALRVLLLTDAITFTNKFKSNAFMNYLVKKNCFFRQECGKLSWSCDFGGELLLPSGYPSKKKLQELHAEFLKGTKK